MKPVSRGSGYLGNWTEALYDEFERIAIQKGVYSNYPDTYPFFLLAAATSLIMSFDEITNYSYPEPILIFGKEEYVENIKVYNLGNRSYFESLWEGEMWDVIPHDSSWQSPFYKGYFFDRVYEDSLTHYLMDIENWYESSEIVSEFSGLINCIIDYSRWGTTFATNMVHIVRFLGQLLFLCKDILREFPDYANHIRRVSFAIECDREAFKKRVTETIRATSRY